MHLDKSPDNEVPMTAHIARTKMPPNAIPELTYLNEELVEYPEGVADRTEAINHRLEHAGLTRKIGTNQVRIIRVMLTGTQEDMQHIVQEGRLKAWCADNLEWLRRTFGAENVVSAVLHMDEATPHLHIDFVPYTTGSKRGLDTRVSLKQALSALGFKGGTRSETELNQWVQHEKKQLAEIMLERGIEWEQKGTHEKHLSVLDFKKKERAKEVAELEAKKESLEEHNVAILETSEKWLGELENLEQEIHSAQKIREEADKKAEVAKKEAARYEKKLVEIAPMVKDMERFAVKYSYDPEEVLPEAGTLESGKSYREKKAKPLIEKIITVLRSVYRAYLDISRNYNDLQRSCERAWNKVNALSQYVEKLRDENIEMKEKLKDVQYLYRVMGKEKVNKIIQQGKEAETIEKMKRQAQRRTQWER